MQEPTGFQQMKGLAFPDQEQLKCPRCQSTNTKFCYYNNYNLSQPRHFCKNCRRYWTKGGALRNIPVGGGSRKNTKCCSSASSSSTNNPKRQPNPSPDLTRSHKVPDPSLPLTTSSTIPQQIVLNSGVQNSCLDTDPTRMFVLSVGHQDRKVMDIGGSFSSLLDSTGRFGNLVEGLNPNGSGLKTVQMADSAGNLDSGRGMDKGSGRDRASEESNTYGESYSGVQGGGEDTSCWTGSSNGCPDLAIYAPGLSFQ